MGIAEQNKRFSVFTGTNIFGYSGNEYLVEYRTMMFYTVWAVFRIAGPNYTRDNGPKRILIAAMFQKSPFCRCLNFRPTHCRIYSNGGTLRSLTGWIASSNGARL